VKYLQLFFLAAIVFVLSSVNSEATEIKIIANASVGANEISVEELRRVFLVKSQVLSNGTWVEPVVGTGGAAHEVFLKKYLQKSDSALNTYYRSLVFTGKGLMPKFLESEAGIIAYVSRTKGAIGYVSAHASATGTKALSVR
jgi:ABC-type phosphate transport system substrate-binding protein